MNNYSSQREFGINEPLVIFIVLNWNQATLTTECIKSLYLQCYTNFKVIVVDNASSDGSSRILLERFPEIKLIENSQNWGYSEGNNIGIRAALEQSPEYIFLLNNDTVVDPLMLQRLVAVAESDRTIGLVGPTMYYFEPPNMIWGGENHIDWYRAKVVRCHMGECITHSILEFQDPKEVDYIDTCAMLVRSQLFPIVGLLNVDYFINFDDLDFNVRVHKAGHRIVYVPSSRMWHKVSATMGLASPSTTYYMGRNSLLFFWNHAPGSAKIMALILLLFRLIRTSITWTFHPKYKINAFRFKRNAILFAVRDFLTGRFGKMGPDVSQKCS